MREAAFDKFVTFLKKLGLQAFGIYDFQKTRNQMLIVNNDVHRTPRHHAPQQD
jgi:hypothetical protein